jgi:hypothetical protein
MRSAKDQCTRISLSAPSPITRKGHGFKFLRHHRIHVFHFFLRHGRVFWSSLFRCRRGIRCKRFGRTDTGQTAIRLGHTAIQIIRRHRTIRILTTHDMSRLIFVIFPRDPPRRTNEIQNSIPHARILPADRNPSVVRIANGRPHHRFRPNTSVGQMIRTRGTIHFVRTETCVVGFGFAKGIGLVPRLSVPSFFSCEPYGVCCLWVRGLVWVWFVVWLPVLLRLHSHYHHSHRFVVWLPLLPPLSLLSLPESLPLHSHYHHHDYHPQIPQPYNTKYTPYSPRSRPSTPIPVDLP